jgi:hypothetical protein
MRKLLILSLSLALALPASATMGTLAQPCPMHDMTSLSAVDETGMGMKEAAMDCCNDLATALRTGKTCKTGLECGGVASLALPMLLPLSLVASHVEPTAWFPTTPPPARLNAIWRPPTPI